MSKIISIFLYTALSAICYRAGGLGKEEKSWIPILMRRTLVRDWLCPLCGLVMISPWLNKPQTKECVNIAVLLYFLFSWGALSTYWKKIFGYSSFYMHGLMCGLAAIPLHWLGVSWYGILASSLFSCILMGWISEKTGNADREELGRGAVFALSKLLLLI